MTHLSDVEKFVFITSVYGLKEGMDCYEIYKNIIYILVLIIHVKQIIQKVRNRKVILVSNHIGHIHKIMF